MVHYFLFVPHLSACILCALVKMQFYNLLEKNKQYEPVHWLFWSAMLLCEYNKEALAWSASVAKWNERGSILPV